MFAQAVKELSEVVVVEGLQSGILEEYQAVETLSTALAAVAMGMPLSESVFRVKETCRLWAEFKKGKMTIEELLGEAEETMPAVKAASATMH